MEQQEPEETDKDKEKKTVPNPASTAVIPHHDLGPNLDRLWEFKCPLTKGRNVSCIAWNKENPVRNDAQKEIA